MHPPAHGRKHFIVPAVSVKRPMHNSRQYGCPLVYKNGWIRTVSAGFEPTINTRAALGGLAERPAVLDAPR